MKSDFIIALTQLAAERNLSKDIVLSAIEAALASAYRRDSIAAGQNISVKLDPNSGDVNVSIVKTVVEQVEDPLTEMTLADAKKISPIADLGDNVPIGELPHSAGRIAAQTAKQVVIQRLREAERDIVFQEYSDKVGEVYTVAVQRIESGRHVIVELGRAEAVLPMSEQSPYDRYRVGQRYKVLLKSIDQSVRGPEIIVSRADKALVRRLFEMEVPEIYNGAVEIVGIAREAGSRSKVAVFARQEGVDAVGSCVGLRGIRIQNIVNELHGEKIDVVEWSRDPTRFIKNSLSPALVMKVQVDQEEETAMAVVPERQLSLAIGKEGQNARLAAKLTGLKIDIISDVEATEREAEQPSWRRRRPPKRPRARLRSQPLSCRRRRRPRSVSRCRLPPSSRRKSPRCLRPPQPFPRKCSPLPKSSSLPLRRRPRSKFRPLRPKSRYPKSRRLANTSSRRFPRSSSSWRTSLNPCPWRKRPLPARLAGRYLEHQPGRRRRQWGYPVRRGYRGVGAARFAWRWRQATSWRRWRRQSTTRALETEMTPAKRHVPLRMCIVCGAKGPKRDFTRIVSTPEDGVKVDRTGNSRAGGVCMR